MESLAFNLGLTVFFMALENCSLVNGAVINRLWFTNPQWQLALV